MKIIKNILLERENIVIVIIENDENYKLEILDLEKLKDTSRTDS